MKIGVITLGFEAENPGGVANVVIKVLDFIVREKSYTVELFSFSNNLMVANPESLSLLMKYPCVLTLFFMLVFRGEFGMSTQKIFHNITNNMSPFLICRVNIDFDITIRI